MHGHRRLPAKPTATIATEHQVAEQRVHPITARDPTLTPDTEPSTISLAKTRSVDPG
jgi:hypothetical protein